VRLNEKLVNSIRKLWRAGSAVLLLWLGFMASSASGQLIYSTPYTFTTYAGTGITGSDDGVGKQAQFNFLNVTGGQSGGIAIDSNGNIYRRWG
jgi:hypothetical protein